eukprot:snap_masked-scaffold_10-processed-gene-8.30-mRNA-1 protein AED:1.00 eAED:1.00 QI:0/0/0/0/1/1/3/0/70
MYVLNLDEVIPTKTLKNKAYSGQRKLLEYIFISMINAFRSISLLNNKALKKILYFAYTSSSDFNLNFNIA